VLTANGIPNHAVGSFPNAGNPNTISAQTVAATYTLTPTYNGMPEGFISLRGGGPTKMTLVGWAADGFPIYARYGYSTASDASSALKVIAGSYPYFQRCIKGNQ
jgi:hypothetical protein